MMRERSAGAMLAACFALATSSACGIKSETAPSNFYLLNSFSSDAAAPGGQPSSSDVAVAIGPVSVPAYLDRPQIVTRGSGNEVTLSEYDRWAEPLRDNITSVLADNLSQLLPTDRVSVFPSALAREVDLRVSLEVIRFDGSLDGNVVLDARWRVFSSEVEAPIRTERSKITQPVSDATYAAVVTAMNRALDSLSREMAAGIRSAAGG